MDDEELVKTILAFMGNAAACPDCFRRNGEQRLRFWLAFEVKGGEDEGQRQVDDSADASDDR